jgi:hypothetical protein
MEHYRIKTVKGELSVHVMAPDKFGGEYDRRSPLYVMGTWFFSSLAMLTNLSEALYRKVAKGGGPLGKHLWEMGRNRDHISSFAVDRLSRFNHQAKYGAAGWRSLDLFYNYHEKVNPQLNDDFEGWLTRHWIGKFENRQAVTNRLKISIDTLAVAIESFAAEKEIRLLSIASGSAQAVVEAMKRHPQLNIKAALIDADISAISEAKNLVGAASFDDRFSFIHDTTNILEKVASDFKPHIIEMVGFLDYRPRTQAIALIDRIRRHLPEGGVFITCNIRKNREKIFLDWVLLWPMIYRTEEEFADLLVHGGFPTENIRLVYEPFKIHGIAVCTK